MDLNEYVPSTQELHAISAHLPIALSMLGVLAVIAAIAIRTPRHSLRWVVVGTYILLAAAAFFTTRTGEDARAAVSGAVNKTIWDTIDHHEEMAEKVWMFAVATAGLMAVSVFAKGHLRIAMNVVTVIACLLTAGWVAVTGHYGGTLVYQHGIGIPPDQVVEWRLHPPADSPAMTKQTEPDRPLIPIEEIDPQQAQLVSYSRDIVPIFEEACIECHKPGDLDSELDMTTVEGLIKGGEKYGPSIVPGKPDESTTIKYVRGELLPQMPKDDFPLTKNQLHTLRMWIFAGAEDDSQGTLAAAE